MIDPKEPTKGCCVRVVDNSSTGLEVGDEGKFDRFEDGLVIVRFPPIHRKHDCLEQGLELHQIEIVEEKK